MFKLFQKKSEFDVLYTKLQHIQKTIDTISSDMANDRHDIDQLKLSQGQINDQLQAIRDLWANQTKKLKEAIADEVEIVTEKINDISQGLTPTEETNKL